MNAKQTQPRNLIFVAEDCPEIRNALKQMIPADRLLMAKDVPTGLALLEEKGDFVSHALMDHGLEGGTSWKLLYELDRRSDIVKFGMSGSKSGVAALETFCSYTFPKDDHMPSHLQTFLRVCGIS